jgi:hypothetical protein
MELAIGVIPTVVLLAAVARSVLRAGERPSFAGVLRKFVQASRHRYRDAPRDASLFPFI